MSGGLASIGGLAGGALALMLVAFGARADQGCPEGLAPIGQAPGPICVPQPGYYGPRSQQAPVAPAATPMPSVTMMPYQRPKFYGVHVSDPQRSQLYSSNYAYEVQDATNLALNYCREQTGHECEVLGAFVDECQAIVIDKARKTYRGVDLVPRLAGREAMVECKKGTSSAECRLWRLPLCSGLGYGDGNFVGKNNGRTDEQIEEEIRIMTRELSAEIGGR